MSGIDLIVIGSGPGGYKTAIHAALQGAKVTLIERAIPGGNCLNQGCIPTKSLVHIAELLDDIAIMQGRGITGDIKPDFTSAMQHKDEVVAKIRAQFPHWMRRLGIRLVHGHASFSGQKTLRIVAEDGSEQTLQSDRVVIATGSKPRQHTCCQPDGETILSSEDFMFRLSTLPKRLLCVGGGAIGCELGFVMHQFGSEVCIVEQAARLLNRPGIPDRASYALARKLSGLGVQVQTGQTVTALQRRGDEIAVTYSNGDQARFDKVLVAIGRQPCSDSLNLSASGVKTDAQGYIQVNQYLETDCAGIYAVGDVTNGPMTANAALHDAKVAASNALNGNRYTCNHHIVPTVIQSALQIATVGLSENMADDAGFEAEAARSNLISSPKALARNETEGFTEITHDEETGQLLGGCIVGPEAGEQIQMLTAACQSERGLWFFNDINYSHPSWCEELENAINPLTSQFNKNNERVFQPGIYAARKR